MSENLIIIGNKKRNHCVNNEKLSWKAKGVHSYLISRPEVWEIRHSDLFNRSTDGMEGTKTGINELLAQKYIYRIHKNSSQGMSWGYLVFDCPTNKEDAEIELNETHPDYFIKELGIKRPTMVKPNSGETDSDINKGKVNNNELGNSKIKLISSSKDEQGNLNDSPEQSLEKSKKRILKKRSKSLTPKMEEILNIYSAIHKCKQGNKEYFKSVKAIRELVLGLFFNNLPKKYEKYYNRKFKFEEIKFVIGRMIVAATSPEHLPTNKKCLNRPFYILAYNPFNKNENFESTFIYYFENEPQYCGNGILIDDPDPYITNTFRAFYRDSVVAGNKKEFTNVQENQLRKASEKAIKFTKDNEGRLHLPPNGKSIYIRMIINAIRDSYDLKDIEIGTLCSKRTWEKIVPVYLADQGILDQVRVM